MVVADGNEQGAMSDVRSADRVTGLRAAIVGAGLMGRWHADAARRAGAEIVAIVDENPSRALTLAARFPGAASFDNLDDAIASHPVDVAHICTPTSTHVALATKAIRARAHVILEKPLAPTRDATGELLDLATSSGRLLCPTHQFLFQTGVRQLFEDIKVLGPLVHVEAMTCSAGADGMEDSDRDRVAGEILPHPLSLFASLFPGELSRARWQATHPAPGELRISTEMKGSSVAILISMAGRPTLNQLRMIGQRASATADLYHGFQVTEPGVVSRSRKIVQPFFRSGLTFSAALMNLSGRALRGEAAYPGLREFVQRFYLAAKTGTPGPISPEATLAVAAARDILLRELGIEA